MTPSPPDVRLVATRTHGRVLVRHAAAPIGILLGFHGYLENADVQLARLESIPGAAAWTRVSVQALNRVYRGRTQETVASWMTREHRETVIEDNIRYVSTVADGFRGAGPIVCVGFSQGGAMAFRAAARGGFGAAAVISAGADVPPELLADASARMPPVLLIRGARDEWLTPQRFDADVAALRARGTRVHPLVVDGAHEWTDEAARAAADFLADLGI
jgi:predicted esterase